MTNAVEQVALPIPVDRSAALRRVVAGYQPRNPSMSRSHIKSELRMTCNGALNVLITTGYAAGDRAQ